MNQSTSRSNDQHSGIQYHPPPGTARDLAMTILVATADPLELAMITEHLHARGHETLKATTGPEVLRASETTRLSAALLDFDLPGHSALELAGNLMEMQSVPVVFLTEEDDERRLYDVMRSGVPGYVFKPGSGPKLLPLIEAARARFAERRALEQQIEQISKALHSCRQVSLAVGVLMARMHLTQQDAFELIRSHSRRTQRRLEDVAVELISAKEHLNRFINSIATNKTS